MSNEYDQKIIADMINWISDCEEDFDAEIYTPREIIRMVASNYSGGVEQFILDGL